MILMIDNYDSFTYNLVQYLKQLDEEVVVKRNDEITIDDIEKMKPSVIIISPGPGKPSSAGISLETVRTFSGRIPILGVCLGHQTIAEAFGGDIILAKKLMHGKVSTVKSDGKTIFQGLGQNFQAMRYHSLAVKKETLPDVFDITAESEDGEIMGIRHKTHLTEGVQFHPESIMTPVGKRLLKNFLKIAKGDE
ncbi:anthranilate synthase component II [Desulforegula conservatrix]|uniref:anthranilate synthase component II n=1 Tax=Desulforegula conservatrix TaxID=153026 RepID=UPI0003FA0AB1|nr:aminodeoxychorismate/anthranilate synthase component II [Desulforegula conservatrix]